MKIMNLKGTFDFLPKEQMVRNQIYEYFKN